MEKEEILKSLAMSSLRFDGVLANPDKSLFITGLRIVICYGGRASDIQVVKESDFHTSKYHMPGDQILADHGFTLVDEFAAGSSSELLIPAFTKGKSQLSAKEVEVSRKIASVRIHIERVIGLLRNRYTILKGIIPLRLIKSMREEANQSVTAKCDRIVMVCAAFTNLADSIVFK